MNMIKRVVGISVPVCLLKTGEVISYQYFINKSMLPDDKKHLWSEKGTAQGILSTIRSNDSVSDENVSTKQL